ncbi:hypothetical protein N7527_012183 [Penicillium freii]|uniref:Uncharacterized protein n=1 Tax=Penicillium freii TaxID=48697 RepID=A0A101MMA3_PENFR|nr:hypothetical protein N7527_012183 [Penicillium freii]KUM63162.1 hypothetical protein ACN42_g3939 [Penicillium freii]
MEAAGSSDGQTATMEVSKETFGLESNTRFEYDPWLLDDHPLRSYPTECIPGLALYLDEYYESIGKRRAILFRAVCLILGCLAAFQCLRLLPTNIKRILPPHASIQHAQIHPQNSACTFPTLDTRPDALKSSLSEGCDGLRTAVWMHHGELQIGNAVTETEPEDFLQRLGLNPLLAKLDAENDATARASLNPETPGSFHADLARTFLLMLDAKTPLHELYPHLVEHLDTLRQRGYLSHWDGQNVVRRPVTIVVTGEAFPESDCVNHSYSDVFWSALPEGGFMMSDFTKDNLRHLSPVCIV